MSTPGRGGVEIATDLVEYFVVVVPGLDALPAVATELVGSVEAAVIRVLDVVVVSVDAAGASAVVELDDLAGLDALRAVTMCPGGLLSSHDLELVALALAPGDSAVVVVAEDRWATPLAGTARAVGGEVRAGERLARHRVETALARVTTRPAGEG